MTFILTITYFAIGLFACGYFTYSKIMDISLLQERKRKIRDALHLMVLAGYTQQKEG